MISSTREGLSINAIARWLNEHHVPTRKGVSPWERTTVWVELSSWCPLIDEATLRTISNEMGMNFPFFQG